MIEKDSYVWGEIDSEDHEFKFKRNVKTDHSFLNIPSDTDNGTLDEYLEISTDRQPWEFESDQSISGIFETIPNSLKMEKISALALPTIASLFIQKMQEVINLSMLGHQTHLVKADMMA